MSVLTWVGILSILAYALIHTVSYALWNWRNNNKAGSLFIMLICLITDRASGIYPVFQDVIG